MRSMSITVEEVEQKIAKASSGTVRIKVPVSWVFGLCLPDPAGQHTEEAEFKVMTVEDHESIESIASYTTSFKGPWGTEYESQALDRDEYGRLLLRRCLRGWTLPLEIRVADGWITRECWQRVGKMPAPLLEAFGYGYQSSFAIGAEEEEDIDKQAGILFSPNGKGVQAPCEAVSMYCNRAAFWDKFGMAGEKLGGLPYREYIRLKVMSSKEVESNRQARATSKKSNTRIAGPGGTRAARS